MTSPLIVCISDIHGCFGTLTRLLNQVAVAHPGVRLAFLGDLIDRGPNSRAVVEFAMKHKIPTVKGNHEDLCLAYSSHTRRGYKAQCANYYGRDVWLANGGDWALGNWPLMRDPGDGSGPYQHDNWVPDDVLQWIEALPAYLIPDAPPDVAGRKLLLSHTGYGANAKNGNWMSALWGRHPGDGDFLEDGYYRVFGHTPQSTPEITDTYAMIDTGAAYTDRGFGIMTALIWPSKAVVQQAFDESPIEQRFEVVDGCIG